jgi:tetratricopeptide (TPR) repeat protein
VTAAENYTLAIEKGEGIASTQMLYNYAIALGGIRAQLDDLSGAISSYEEALGFIPDSSDAWRVQIALAQLYARQGDLIRAREYANAALSTAPADQQQAITDLLAQLGGNP